MLRAPVRLRESVISVGHHAFKVVLCIRTSTTAMTTPSSAMPAEPNERQPLLDRETLVVEGDAAGVSGDFGSGLEEQQPGTGDVPRPRKKRSKGEIAWYIVLGLLSVLLLVVFVKGFVDSQDVEVRRWSPEWPRGGGSLRCHFS